MPRIPKKGEVCRLTLQTSRQVRDQMEAIRDDIDADSLVEVVRRSLAVYETLIKARSRGAEIIVRDGNKEREVLLS